jgi:hypothetical protein
VRDFSISLYISVHFCKELTFIQNTSIIFLLCLPEWLCEEITSFDVEQSTITFNSRFDLFCWLNLQETIKVPLHLFGLGYTCQEEAPEYVATLWYRVMWEHASYIVFTADLQQIYKQENPFFTLHVVSTLFSLDRRCCGLMEMRRLRNKELHNLFKNLYEWYL